MRGHGGRDWGIQQEMRRQIMRELFGDDSDEESDEEEEQHPDGEVVTDVNQSNHGHGGDGSHYRTHHQLLASANTNYAFESNNSGRRCDYQREGQGESQSPVGRTDFAHHVELSYQKMRDNKKAMSNEKEVYDQKIVTSRTRFVAIADEKCKNGAQTRTSGPTKDDRVYEVLREVFGDSDEDDQDSTEAVNRTSIGDEGHSSNYLQSENRDPDKDKCYESDPNFERDPKERPIGSPLNMVVSSKLPPGRPDKMHVIKMSNLMGIDPKPFRPETHVEENSFITDESGGTKRIHVPDNIIRWRWVKNADGTVHPESNARFVKWKDGSMQLLIGDKALDVSVNDINHEHSHLFLKTREGLRSQGRLLQNMTIVPPLLSSRSHSSPTALVDSQNKEIVKVQTCHDTKDPERVKQEREREQERRARKGKAPIHSKEESPPRKPFNHRKAVVFDSDSE